MDGTLAVLEQLERKATFPVPHTERIDAFLRTWRDPSFKYKNMHDKFHAFCDGESLDAEDLAYLRRAGLTKSNGKELTDFGQQLKKYFDQRGRDTGREHTKTETPKSASYSKKFLKTVRGKKFRHPDTGNMVLFSSLPSAERARIYQESQRGTSSPSEEAEEAMRMMRERGLEFKPSAENRRNLQKMLNDLGFPEITVVAPMDDSGKKPGKKPKKASYAEEFMKAVEGQTFHNPETGNKVKFVSLPQAEQQKVYQQWTQAQQAQSPKEDSKGKAEEKKAPKKPKRPTFPQARDAAFRALEEAGWSVKKHLKVPKAERDIGGDRVILHFRPQAVYMEVAGKMSHPLSLHTDIRDVDPKQWVESLAGEARQFTEMEERLRTAALRLGAVRARKYSSSQQKFQVSPKEKTRASEDGVTLLVRPQEGSNLGVFAVEAANGRPVGVNWYEVESKQELPTAIRLLNRDLNKFHGRGDQMSERGRFRDKQAAFSDEFLKTVKDRKFRNPDTGNEVKFISLPAAEQTKIYQQWGASRQEQSPPGEARSKSKPGEWIDVGMAPVGAIVESQGRRYEITKSRFEKADARDLETGKHQVLHDSGDNILVSLPGQKTAEATMSKQDRLKKARTRWAQMSPQEREALRRSFAEMMHGPGVPAVMMSGQRPGDEEPEPAPPAEVKRMLADRMRELARSLMIAGTRQPRQQMMEISKAIDTLLEQLDMLADQPGRDALRRRILLNLRQRTTA